MNIPLRSSLALALLPVVLVGELSAQDTPPQAVRVDAVREELLASRRFVTGELRAARRSSVAGREPGLILESPVREGMVVTSGQLLARLDDRQLQLDRAELAADRVVLEATVTEREAELELRVWQEEAMAALRERGSGYERELREARSATATAQARLDQSRKQLGLIDAQDQQLDQRIADMRVVAPFDAVVVRKESEVGEWLSAGGTVCELISTQELEVWLDVPQDLVAAVTRESAEMELRVDAVGLSRRAESFRVIPEVDPRSRSFRVIVPLDGGAEAGLQAGMSASAWIATDRMRPQLSVHKDAVLRSEAGAYVIVARPTTPGAPPVAQVVSLEPLFGHGLRVVVRADRLQAGDSVVVEGNERLFPGTPLKPLPMVAGDDTGVPGAGR